MMPSAVPCYDARYAQGGWLYRDSIERPQLQTLLEQAGLEPPAAVVEVACGMGFHTNLLRDLGYRAVGNDYSEVGIAAAKERYPDIEFHFGDSTKLSEKVGLALFDGVLARGHSHHHYGLPVQGLSVKRVDVMASTRAMFELAKTGGL